MWRAVGSVCGYLAEYSSSSRLFCERVHRVSLARARQPLPNPWTDAVGSKGRIAQGGMHINSHPSMQDASYSEKSIYPQPSL